ncbi:leucine-rich repeat-containing protein [Tanacetum coccineum]
MELLVTSSQVTSSASILVDGSEIQREIGRFSKSLTHLNLSGCWLSGQVPPDITLLHKLVYLDLSANPELKLRRGVFINLIHNVTNLEGLALKYVNISSVLPHRLNISSFLKFLYLPGIGLKGKLPHYIFNLHSLEKLDLSENILTGDIPSDISVNLTHLTYLNLYFNKLNGTLPSWLFTLPSLEYLDLSANMFGGNVPFESFALPSLKVLDLSGNQLVGHTDVQTFRRLTNLTHVGLSYNNFSGELEIGGVNISSALPDRLNISSSLKLLNLADTGLKGKLPHYIFNLHSLETLDLYSNTLTGDIPSDISVSLTHLTYLRLSYNRLTGTLPSWLFTSPSLEYLGLSGNMFSGNVPFELFALPSLKALGLSDNQLVGHTDVQTFRRLTNLTHLYLSNNNFSGEWELDTLLSSLTNLEYLDLSYSGFSVTTKNANHYVNPAFRDLRLASCKLKVFPNSLRAMRQLEQLDLSSNEIYGQIPHWAGEIGGNELHGLDLSHNFITGLPQFQGNGLKELHLKSNLIQGPFPSSICNISSLESLDMSNNRIIGVIPKNISSSLQVLNVKSNKIEGSFPPSICNMSFLASLDISDNCIGGVIPECVGSMNKLSMINLGANNFHGTIPNVFNASVFLEGLILNGNQLEGEVPHSLSKCQFLRVLDLGNNKLSGTFPIWLGSLSKLRTYLKGKFQTRLVALTRCGKCSTYRTQFNGEIPNALGNISGIESLDLSWNQLIGEIPQSLAEINGLAVLNLSENQLVGRIPTGTQFNTFDESSFEGNLGLCGRPLTKMCSEHTHKPQLESHEEESGFTWEVVTLGFGCGTLLGLVMGYLMLSTRKVKWFNAIADATESLAEEFRVELESYELRSSISEICKDVSKTLELTQDDSGNENKTSGGKMVGRLRNRVIDPAVDHLCIFNAFGEYTGNLSHLGTAERFLKVLIEIPFAFKRLESLLFMCTFQEEESMIKESFTTLEVFVYINTLGLTVVSPFEYELREGKESIRLCDADGFDQCILDWAEL